MPARSKRSKANQENSRKKYSLDAQVDVNESLVSNAFAERQNASVNTEVAVGAESEWQPPHAKLVYFAEVDKSLKRTIYPDHMVAQLRSAIDIFEKVHPGCVAVFCFDQSSNHQAMSHDALVMTKLTLNAKPNSVPIVDGFFEQDGQIVRQAVIYPENNEKAGQQKGIRTILKERNLWRDGLLLKCNRSQGIGPVTAAV
ncbi:hypothetical protein V1520DRAFT_343505, partial [Lipomyces starkeyi]